MKAKTKQDIQFEALYAKAWAAGAAAVGKVEVQPMVVGEPTSLFAEDIDYTKQVYVVEGGPCGFAWINVKPANSAFGKWLKKTEKVRSLAYGGGYNIWISDYGQSMARKEAHANAMAQVLREAGIRAYADARMD